MRNEKYHEPLKVTTFKYIQGLKKNIYGNSEDKIAYVKDNHCHFLCYLLNALRSGYNIQV